MMFAKRLQLIHPLFCLALLCCCCWFKLVASSALTENADGQLPWLVVWRKGVDGDLLWDKLCPTISIGDELGNMIGSTDDLLTVSDASRNLQSSGAPELVLNCSAKFEQLFNGIAGHFTLKEVTKLQDSYKHSVDHVVSDKPIAADGPLERRAAQGRQRGSSASSQQPTKGDSTGTSAQEAGPQMVMEFPASGTQPHRQLLFTPPQHLAGPARRRMLPEMYNATWGLDILDQGQLPLDTIYHYTYNGTGVHVYILDTGIRTTHEEFRDPGTGRTRAVHGYDAVYKTNSSEDCHGHGSHVAAVVGGNTFGVAKNVTLHAVRVLACDGTAMVSALLRGLEWVAKNHIKPAVVHMSIEGGFSSIVNQAVEQLIKVNHVHVVVSSGNSNKDACLASPASSPSAITVAAIDDKLNRWAYANWGACVDVFAPGVAILSAVSNKGDDGTAIKTGTSMAAPFVTGVVAAYLETHPGASPEEVQQKLYQRAMRGIITDDPQGFATMYPSQFPDLTDISSTPNRLVRSNLTDQASLSPGRLVVTEDTTDPLVINITLSQQPSDAVTISVTVPGAWDGTPMAEVYPSELVFTPDTWDQTQGLVLQPRLVCDGDYFVKLSLQGPAGEDYPALHTVLVNDFRRRSGDTAAMARVINKLPFTDTGDSTDFADNYGCQATDASPDVVYSYTATQDSDVTISTCGSGFDTKLLVSTNLNDPSTYMCNDDDRTCVSNTACSRLDVSFKAGQTYYIVVDGYSGASGEYTLAVNCNPTCPPPPGSGTVDSMDIPNMPQTIGEPGPVNPNTNVTSNTRLIQTLLHLSHAPSASHEAAAEVQSPSPEPPLAPSPSPAMPPSPSPGPRRNARTPPIGSAVRPNPAEGSDSDAGSPAGPQEQGAAPAVQGPIGVLLGNTAGAAASQAPAAVPAEGTGRGPLVPVPGPLGVIQASSFEGRNNAQDNSTDASQDPADAGKNVPVSSSKDDTLLKTQHNEKGVSPVPINPPSEHVVMNKNRNYTKADTASVGDTAGKAPPSTMLPVEGPEGRRPQQVDQPQQAEQLQPDANLLQQPQHGTSTTDSGKQVIELVPDLGGPIGLKHAGDEEDDQQLSVVQTGLGHGAGGFSSSGSVRVVGKQSSRFADLDAMLGTPSGSAGEGVGGSGVGADEHVLGNDAAGPRTTTQVDVQTALGGPQQSGMSSSQGSGVSALVNERDHGNDVAGPKTTAQVDVHATLVDALQTGTSATGSSSTSKTAVAVTASQQGAAGPAAGGEQGDRTVVGSSTGTGRNAAGWEVAAGDLAAISSESEQLLPVAMNDGR